MDENKLLKILTKYEIDLTNKGAYYITSMLKDYSEELKQLGVKYCMDKMSEKYNTPWHTIKSDIRICLAKSKLNNMTPKKALYHILYSEIL